MAPQKRIYTSQNSPEGKVRDKEPLSNGLKGRDLASGEKEETSVLPLGNRQDLPLRLVPREVLALLGKIKKLQ